MKGKRNHDYDRVAHLIPLRVTGDVNVDEAKSVDEAVRYDDKSRSELDSYSKALNVLHEAASLPVPGESPIVRGDGGSLWDRIEPQLGPAGRMRPTGFDRVPTRYLAAACVALVFVTAANESRKIVPGVAQFGNVIPVERSLGTQGNPAVTGQRIPQGQITVPADFVRYLMGERMEIPEAGIVVARPDRISQKQLGLPDLNGVIVGAVQEGSLGQKAGLLPGDFIFRVNGKSVYAPRHLRELVIEAKAEGEPRFERIRHRESVEPGPEPNDEPLRIGPASFALPPDLPENLAAPILLPDGIGDAGLVAG